MKKVLSLVLVIAMVLSSMSFAFAGTFEDVVDTDYEKAINTLAGLGIITGYEDGTFRPERVVTRAEMAKLMVEILGYGDLVAGAKSNFSDTQGHWADQWIAIAAGRNIVIGTGDGKFTPDRAVSYDEVLTMIVRGLGYTDDSNEIKSMTWPTNFKVKAAELGITDDVKMNTTGADRGGVAQVLYNALDATLVSVDTEGNVVYLKDAKQDYAPLLSRIANSKTLTVQPGHVNKDSKIYAGDIVELEQYMYQTLKVYTSKTDSDIVVYVKGSDSLVVEGAVDEVTATTINVKDKDGRITKVPFKGIEDSAMMYYNGEETDMPVINANLEDYENIKIVAFEDDNTTIGRNGKIDAAEIVGIVVDEQTRAAVVEHEYVDGKTKVDVFELPIDANKDVIFDQVKVEGAVDSIEDIAEDDTVVEYAARKNGKVVKTRLVVSRETVEGKVSKVDATNGAVTIDGTKYSLNSVANPAIELGDEGTFYLDHNGKVVDSEANTILEYAAVVGFEKGEVSTKFGTKTIKTYPQVKVRTTEDEVVVYDLFVKVNSKGEITDALELNDVVIDFKIDENDKIQIVDALESLDDSLIKYALNKDDKINEISTDGIKSTGNIDKEDAEFKLAENVVIFDKTGTNYPVVSMGRLKDPFAGKAGYNKNGEIVALLTDDVKEGSVDVYAYIDKASEAYDADGDAVLEAIAFMKGEKVEYLTDDARYFGGKGNTNKVYALELDGEIITNAIAWDDAELDVTAKNIEVKSVSTATNSVLATNGIRYYLTDDATIVELTKTLNVDKVADLYDLRDRVITLYIDNDNDNNNDNVVFVTFSDLEAAPDVDVEGKVSFINVEEGLIEVDDEVLELDKLVKLVDADGKTLELGPKNVAKALKVGDVIEKITVNKDGVVTKLELAKDETEPEVPENPEVVNVTINVVAAAMNFKEITVEVDNDSVATFSVKESSLEKNVGESIRAMINNATTEVTLYDADGEVVEVLTVNVAESKEFEVKVEL